MTYYIRNGNTFRVTDEKAVDIQQRLPAANYIIKEDQFGELYLEIVDNFTPISKLYGRVPSYSERILNTFQDRPNTTGAMFTGEKGSGKSLLAKEICIKAQKLGIPTIIINSPWSGDKFNSLIQDIDQEAVLLFDEFEKVYHDSYKQEAILTLLDGVFPTKKLFILTSNDKWRIDQHMRNRPGRLFYMIDFKGVDREFIIEYCEDNLNDKSHIEKIANLASLFAEFNFDMLKALVEDMNRYNETPQEAMAILNAKPEYEKNSNSRYDITLITPCGQVVPSHFLEFETYNSNPLSAKSIEIYIDVTATAGGNQVTSSSSASYEKDEERQNNAAKSAMNTLLSSYLGDNDTLIFEQENLMKVDGSRGVFEFLDGDGFRLFLQKQVPTTFDYFSKL